jgi:hypothetical protein
MMGQDQVGTVRDDEVVLQGHAARGQLPHLLLEGPGIDDHPVAHHAQDPRMEDARRDQVKDEMLLADLDGVAGVVAAVEAGHDLDLLGEQVHDLSLAFVAPLGADHDNVGHADRPF